MPEQIEFRKLLKIAVTLLAAAGLGACANTQHKISVEPELYVKQADFGGGKRISLKVVDKRSQFAVFSRKAAPKFILDSSLQTVTIVPRSSIGAPIYEKVRDALRQLGFRPTPGGKSPRRLLLEVVQWKLTYQHHVTEAAVHGRIKTAIRVTAGNGGKRFKNIYRTSMEKSGRMIVGKFKNEVFVNNGLSLALQKIFEDKRLLIFLAE